MTASALCVKGWTDMRPDSRENLIQDLLNNVHSEERKISCLDYLLYQIRKTSA